MVSTGSSTRPPPSPFTPPPLGRTRLRPRRRRAAGLSETYHGLEPLIWSSTDHGMAWTTYTVGNEPCAHARVDLQKDQKMVIFLSANYIYLHLHNIVSVQRGLPPMSP